jgi:hypothetical protein
MFAGFDFMSLSLCYAGLALGLFTVAVGAVGLCRRDIRLTQGKRLTGAAAVKAALAYIAAGACLIGFVAYMMEHYIED